MTRYVRRRRKPRIRKPWEWKGFWPTGAPKTTFTNIHYPIYRQITGQTRIPVGDYDPLLRLYRRRQPDSVLPEWDDIPEGCQWIELVDEDEEIVLRIDMESARMAASRNRRGQVTVSLDHYTEYEQEN